MKIALFETFLVKEHAQCLSTYWQQSNISSLLFLLIFTLVSLGSKRSYAAFSDLKPRAPLIAAILSNDRKEVRKLLQSHPRQVAIREHLTGWTPLHYAVRQGSVKIVKMLLDAKAPASVQDKRGRTPLHIAAVQGSFVIPKFPLPDRSVFPKIIERLIKAHRALDQKDSKGNTPLLLAAQSGFGDTAHALIAHGAVVNEPNTQGQTALHVAVLHDHVRIVRLLMQSGAHAHWKDNESVTPIALAQGKEYLWPLLRTSMVSP